MTGNGSPGSATTWNSWKKNRYISTCRTFPLARLYQRHISPAPPPILVKGEPLYLQNPTIADDIRACLLAGLRAVVLWRQCGGKRWQVLLGRRRLADTARSLLQGTG